MGNTNENEFLNYIYENAKMGIVGIANIKSSIKDKKFFKVIKEQEQDYYEICTRAMKLLSLTGGERHNVSGMAKVMTFIDAKMNLLRDDSVSNIAKMMIKGNNMGLMAVIEKINNYDGENKKAMKLAHELRDMLERNIENLKKYL